MLTLSACQTVAGNDRSAFGLAGVAIRSGIPSLIGSLWFANDEISADFMADFYLFLKQGMSSASALQRAQIRQITQYSAHPSDWGNYVLLGKWF